MHIFSLIGAIFTGLLGIFALWKELNMRRNGVYTTGVVIDVKREAKDEGGVTYRPLIRFVINDGQEITWRSINTSSSWGNALGKQMHIIYDPRNPQRVIMNRLAINLVGIAICFFLCAICIVFFFK